MSSQNTIESFLNGNSKSKLKLSEIKNERKFVSLGIISKHLFCTICQEVLDNPWRVKCGHTFCIKCINEWTKKNPNCPICREKCNVSEFSKDLIAASIIGDLEVTCIHTSCPWKSTLCNLNEHLIYCYFDPTKMPTHIKSFLVTEEVKQTEDAEDKVNSNTFLDFNPNIGLKARLYQRNKELLDKVLLNDNSIQNAEQRDSFLDLFNKRKNTEDDN